MIIVIKVVVIIAIIPESLIQGLGLATESLNHYTYAKPHNPLGPKT